ncbi:hypothetical protein J6590_039193 [Homalodisca vitripennis]|nr:hypothetical protein J6590_039193 [Homalodisca vitripennis]
MVRLNFGRKDTPISGRFFILFTSTSKRKYPLVFYKKLRSFLNLDSSEQSAITLLLSIFLLCGLNPHFKILGAVNQIDRMTATLRRVGRSGVETGGRSQHNPPYITYTTSTLVWRLK